VGEDGESLTTSSIHTKSYLDQKNDDNSVLSKKKKAKKKKIINIQYMKKEKREKEQLHYAHPSKNDSPLLYFCCIPPRPIVHTHYVCCLALLLA